MIQAYRKIVQYLFLAVTLLIGVQFSIFVSQLEKGILPTIKRQMLHAKNLGFMQVLRCNLPKLFQTTNRKTLNKKMPRSISSGH